MLNWLHAPLFGALLLAAVAQAQAAPSDLHVMTFNIRYGTANDGENAWPVRKPRTMQALNRRHPDLIGMQEALTGQLEDLHKGLKGYNAVGVGRDDGRADGEYSAILYNTKRLQLLKSDTFWLSDTPGVPGSRSWGNHVVRICTWAFFKDLQTGKYFYHFNAHLDHESQNSREKSIELIMKRIAERATPDPVIFTGDFNVAEDNPVVPMVKAAGFRDSFRVLHPDAKDVGTFNGWNATPEPEKIDYIWVDPKTEVLSAEIVRDKVDGHWISDHSPVIATLKLP